MWKKLPDAAITRHSERRVRLYADEDIEEEVVEWLREKKVNVTSARELGHRGKPDSFHVALAFRKQRFLLTKNGKHFLPNRAVPPDRFHGIIVVEGDMRNMEPYARAMTHVLKIIIPFGDHYAGTKFHVQQRHLTMYFRDFKGQYRTQRFSMESGGPFEWVEGDSSGK
jgi:predicted nuclease of predicted toxin-antitoxin system